MHSHFFDIKCQIKLVKGSMHMWNDGNMLLGRVGLKCYFTRNSTHNRKSRVYF